MFSFKVEYCQEIKGIGKSVLVGLASALSFDGFLRDENGVIYKAVSGLTSRIALDNVPMLLEKPRVANPQLLLGQTLVECERPADWK